VVSANNEDNIWDFYRRLSRNARKPSYLKKRYHVAIPDSRLSYNGYGRTETVPISRDDMSIILLIGGFQY